MRRALTILLGVLVLSQCVVFIVQWRREYVLRSQISDLRELAGEQSRERVLAEAKAARFQAEIERIAGLRKEMEAALQLAREEVTLLTADMQSRGRTLGSFSRMVQELRALPGATGPEEIRARNAEVGGLNAAIQKANATIRKVAGERDDAIARLNTLTRKYNDLAKKVNGAP